jgi:hypothetical protein
MIKKGKINKQGTKKKLSEEEILKLKKILKFYTINFK